MGDSTLGREREDLEVSSESMASETSWDSLAVGKRERWWKGEAIGQKLDRHRIED